MEHINQAEFIIAMLARNANHDDCDFVAEKEDGYELHELNHEPNCIDLKKAEFANNFVKQIKKIKTMENKDYKLIDFDINKAKTPQNPNGLEVVTEDNISVRIICTDRCYEYPIVGLVHSDSEVECVHSYKKDGLAYSGDGRLCLKEPVKPRRMTCQELSWWLRDCPEEHREFIYYDDDDSDYTKAHKTVFHDLQYDVCDADTPIDNILIRSNGGDWREPIMSNGGNEYGK